MKLVIFKIFCGLHERSLSTNDAMNYREAAEDGQIAEEIFINDKPDTRQKDSKRLRVCTHTKGHSVV